MKSPRNLKNKCDLTDHFVYSLSLTPHIHSFRQHLFNKWAFIDSFIMQSICIKYTQEMGHSDRNLIWSVWIKKNIRLLFKKLANNVHNSYFCFSISSYAKLSLFSTWKYGQRRGLFVKGSVETELFDDDEEEDSNNNNCWLIKFLPCTGHCTKCSIHFNLFSYSQQ